MRPRLTADYFDELYAGDPDPWGFETSPYEQAKWLTARFGAPAFRDRTPEYALDRSDVT
jgi:hypothetical protein